MMKWTDRHCRAFHRILTRNALLYSEMITADAILHGPRKKLLDFSAAEHPLALQLGGSEPDKLAHAAQIGEEWGYDEINLNCGCPSERVQTGAFGASLMREPKTVARCISAMKNAVTIPVTVKCRIGLDHDPPCLMDFVQTVADAGCHLFIVHARKAWLKGLDPGENRHLPPLDYELVAEMKRSRPDLHFVLNGGVSCLKSALGLLPRFDGIMLGRAAYKTPALLGDVDSSVFAGNKSTSPFEAALSYRTIIAAELARGVRLHAMTRHILGLFSGHAGARRFRRILSEQAPGASAGEALSIYDRALDAIGSPQPA